MLRAWWIPELSNSDNPHGFGLPRKILNSSQYLLYHQHLLVLSLFSQLLYHQSLLVLSLSYSGPRYGTHRLDNRMRGGVNGWYWQYDASPAGYISILIEVLNALIWERKKWLMWEPQALWEGRGKANWDVGNEFPLPFLSRHQRGGGGGRGGGGCNLLGWEANM